MRRGSISVGEARQEEAIQQEAPPEDAPPIVGEIDLVGPAVPLAQPFHVRLVHSIAFALSALLSPYLVIPFGTIGIVATQPQSLKALIQWTLLSILFSTAIPALYVIFQIWRGKITDVHVMEREQRGGPFLVAVLSSFIGAFILYKWHAPKEVWSIGVVLGVNGIIMLWISSRWKISMHVAVLSATVLVAIIMIPDINPWRLMWMIPALMWARVTRGRHSIWQGLAACAVACTLTGGLLTWIIGPRLFQIFGFGSNVQIP